MSKDKSEISQQIKTLVSHLNKKRKRQFLMILFLMILGSLSEVVSIGLVVPFLGALSSPEVLFEHELVKPIVNFLEISSPEGLLLPFTIIFISVVIMAGSIRLVLLYTMIRFSHAIGSDLGVNVYRRTLYQDYSSYVEQNSSEIINSVIVKVNTITGEVIKPLLVLISSLLLILGIVSVLLVVDTQIALTAFLGFGAIYLLAVKLTHVRLRSNSKLIADHSTRIVKSLQEGLGSFRDVLIENTQDFFCRIYKNSDQLLRRASGDNSFIAGSPRFVMEGLGITLIAVLAYSLRVGNDGFEGVLPVLGALALGAQRLLPVMQNLYDSLSTLKGSQSSLQDVLELLDQELPLYLSESSKRSLPFRKDISLRNVSFRYSLDSHKVLSGINLTFNKGSRIGFVGKTGSGKSTLMDLVMGLIHPSQGAVEIDGVLLNRSNQHVWWKNIAHVPQNIYLSDSTLIENIAFGLENDKVDLESVVRAAKCAQIHSFIESLPQGYKTRVGERGVRLSGGQRQRIGIARALYKGADVVVLDEATSALDSKTEADVMRSIEDLNKDVTILIIAHRITTLKTCDAICVLKDGEIEKILTYEELVRELDLS